MAHANKIFWSVVAVVVAGFVWLFGFEATWSVAKGEGTATPSVWERMAAVPHIAEDAKAEDALASARQLVSFEPEVEALEIDASLKESRRVAEFVIAVTKAGFNNIWLKDVELVGELKVELKGPEATWSLRVDGRVVQFELGNGLDDRLSYQHEVRILFALQGLESDASKKLFEFIKSPTYHLESDRGLRKWVEKNLRPVSAVISFEEINGSLWIKDRGPLRDLTEDLGSAIIDAIRGPIVEWEKANPPK